MGQGITLGMQIGLAIIVLIYASVGIASMIFVGRSGKKFIVAGKSLPLVLVGTMLMAQAVDANSTLGSSSQAYLNGFWPGFVFPLGLTACLIVTGLFYAKPLNRMHLITLPDFYFRRYGKNVELLISILMIISYIILVAGNIAGVGWIASWVFPVNFVEGMLVMALIVFAYTVTGGIFASVTTNVIQLYPAIAAFAGGVIWLINKHGWDFFAASIPADFVNLTGIISLEHGALTFWASLLALAFGDVVALDFMERVFCAETPEVAQKGCFIGALFTVIIGISASMLGLMGLSLFPEIADVRNILPQIATEAVPFIFGLFILAGVIGAGASTASGGLLAVSAVLSRNILQRNVFANKLKKMGEEEREKFDQWLLNATRLAGVPVMIIAIIFAYIRPEPGVLLVLAFDVVFAGGFIPLTLGLFWKKANTSGALAGVLTGSILRLILYFAIPEHLAGLDTLIPPVASLLVMVPVSLMTQKRDKPNHEIIYETPTEEQVLSGEY